MIRNSILPVVVLALAGAAGAQVGIGPQGPYRTEAAARERWPEVHRLTITPVPEPDPPLKYALYPRAGELKPGNSVPYWYRAQANLERRAVQGEFKPLYDHMDAWLNGPVAELPVQDVRGFLARFGHNFEQAQVAASREEADWDLRFHELRGQKAITFPLNEVQETRTLARLLTLKARLEIADGRYDDAVMTLRIGYRLAHDVAEIELYIPVLVGTAIVSILDQAVLDLIDAPGSPNLYWALATRPQPQFDLRRATEWELTLAERMFPWLADIDSTHRGPAEWQAEFRQTTRDLLAIAELPLDDESPDWQLDFLTTAFVLRGYPAAKRDLIAWGRTPNEVESQSIAQVVARHQVRQFRHTSQQMLKWAYVPSRDARDGAAASDRRLRDEGGLAVAWQGRETFPISGSLMPGFHQVLVAVSRPECRLAGLKVVEAIRMHAAASGGQIPAALDQIRVAPVPVNPATNAPFGYRVEDGHAILDIDVPPTEDPATDWRIVIRVEAP